MLPHGYPFRLIDRRTPDGGVVLQVTGNAALVRGAQALPPFLLVEMMAQAALVALPQREGEPGAEPEAAPIAPAPQGVLAGLQDVRLDAAVRPGDRLEARAQLLGRLGGAVKAHVELRRDGEPIAAGDLLLSLV